MFDFILVVLMLIGAVMSVYSYVCLRDTKLFTRTQAANIAVQSFMGIYQLTWKQMAVNVFLTALGFYVAIYFELVYTLYTSIVLYIVALTIDIVTTFKLRAVRS